MAPAVCRRCAVFLALALGLDAAGLALVLAGTVGRPSLDGRPYEDFLALSGGLLLFLSLLCWLFWYSGNLRGVADEELPLGARPGPGPGPSAAPRSHASLLRLAAKLSERLSQRRRRPAPAPSLPAAALLVRPPDPLELGSLRPDPGPRQGATAERLV